MSKSRHFSKTVGDEYEEDHRPRKKNPPDKRKERRIVRALKTKNVDEYLSLEEENTDSDL